MSPEVAIPPAMPGPFEPTPPGPFRRPMVRVVHATLSVALIALLVILLPLGLALLAFTLAGMVLFALWTILKARVRLFIHRHTPPGPDPDGRENVRLRT
jgi:hypothetical protein